MVTIFVNGICMSVPESMTILQACSLLNLDIPRFCYHEKLSIAGNCRMCLVEVNTSRKLVVSCAMPVSDNLSIKTNTLRVRKARESVLEFLLINHPLDCPICDQGGECDLQDLTMIFGSDRGRYYEISKRAVVDKDFGLLIKTFMTRCIHCTRCIRFFVEVCGMLDVGIVGRGGLMEIGTYVDRFFDHELLGNVIDLCPVGALTSKPFMFRARSWELVAVETVDILDGMCSSIRIDVVGTKVLRVLPSVNELINEEWITNRIRFFYDSIVIQRLIRPMLRLKRFYELCSECFFVFVSWLFVLRFIFFFSLFQIMCKYVLVIFWIFELCHMLDIFLPL